MTQDKAQAALWQLVLDDLIDREMNRVVEAARSLMETYLQEKRRMERKQLSNLVGVTGETRSVAVIADFVRYQMGRDGHEQSWRAGEPPFGEAVLKHIDELKKRAGQLVRQAKAKGVAPSDEAAEIDRVWWLLVRRFAAYLEHSFIYYKR